GVADFLEAVGRLGNHVCLSLSGARGAFSRNGYRSRGPRVMRASGECSPCPSRRTIIEFGTDPSVFPKARRQPLSSAMQFDLTDLRLFAAVAEERKLTRAAARQHLSLAAASARIRGLEEQAGLPLLVREPRGVRLTPAGEAFLHHARAILRQVENLRADLQEYGGGLRGHLRIFANTTAVSDILPAILPRVLAGNPRINVELQEKPNADIARGVLEGRADIGIVSSRVDTLGLEAVHFSTDQLGLGTAAGHRFARRKRVEFAEVLDEDLIGMYAGSTLQTFLTEVSEALGKPMQVRVRVNSFDAVCRIVATGVGAGVVPESAARRNQASLGIAIVELAVPWRVRERYALVRDIASLPAAGQALLDALRAYDPRPHPPGRARRRA